MDGHQLQHLQVPIRVLDMMRMGVGPTIHMGMQKSRKIKQTAGLEARTIRINFLTLGRKKILIVSLLLVTFWEA